ncbi:MAG TPA: porin, partial [Polyangia bacterium]|nr:porin [Polyangia bacterium]
MRPRLGWCVFALVSVISVGRLARGQGPPPGPPPPVAPTGAPPPPAPAEPSEWPPPAPANIAYGPPPHLAPAPPAAPTAGLLKIEGANASLKIGLLAQPQYEAVGNGATNGLTHNLFLRRIRILIGGTLFKDIEYFLDTDYPNLFKATAGTDAAGMPTFLKSTPGLNIQDAFFTWKALGDLIKVDAGYMFPPLSHQAVQSAATLYGLDYFSNTFRNSGAFGNSAPDPVGRDLGLQLRGLVIDGHLEYRVGLFQGLRNAPAAPEAGGRNFFRVAARLQINLLDAEPGFFYAGTYLGAKRILSVGGSFDFQDDYKQWNVDGFADLPLGPGGLTAQVDLVQWNGGTYIATLPKQTALMAEAGYRIAPIEVSPIVRFEQRWVTNETAAAPDETRIGG